MAAAVSAVTFPDSPKPFRYVNDYTKTLSEKQLDALEAKLEAYGKETSSQIAVVIVPTTGEYEISQYTFELGDKWGIGRKNLNIVVSNTYYCLNIPSLFLSPTKV